MPCDVAIVHVDEEPPTAWSAAVYLCGPTPTDPREPSWRPDAVAALRAGWAGEGTLAVFVPEPSEGGGYPAYADQIRWEEEAMRLSDVVAFYIPRDMARLPGLVSNIKWGAWCDSGRAVLGAPPEAVRMEYLLHFAGTLGVPVARSVEETVRAALDRIGPGVHRTVGERAVPLRVWHTGPFQQWYAQRRAAGDRLLDAHVEWYAPPAEWLLTVTVEPAGSAGSAGSGPVRTRLLSAQGQGMLM
ncbi:nucleoside 2-deoxyribosyltransferase domain-containing protein [Streptomyces xanthophaeus]|uniref:nucleoside 2-deoxyribosyltransferase domain-containing protein n=1 Tax=Streptomyces xanthophaeus TaxID=67385 RepID=UPI0005667D1D|nr:nucleoside 2-deoxyribosyltransferase domain-containing protein [Streptomyces xanthophaeus]